jgi:DNA-binding transcriptional ArsR family regulator
VARQSRFTRIPKIAELLGAGVPVEVVPTYCALADYSANKSGLCYPKMETLASTLNRSVRTVQRHLHLLRKLGYVEFVHRRRNRGRYSSYLYRLPHIVRTTVRTTVGTTTGHGKRVARPSPNRERTKGCSNSPLNPPKEAFNWFFGKERNLQAENEHKKHKAERRRQEAEERREGYEWLFR